MAAAVDNLLDLTVRHAVGLERYKAGLVRQLVPLLNATTDDVESILASRLVRALASGYDAGPATTERVLKMMDEIADVRREAYDELAAKLMTELLDVMTYEVGWQEASLRQVLYADLELAKPTAELLRAAATERPFEGHLLKDWVDDLAPADLDRIRGAVQLGVVEGKSLDDVVRSVVGSGEASYADGVLEVSRRGVEGLVRTSVNHVVTQAREETYDANRDVVSGVRWCSTLDGRTTLICIDRDGKVYPVREGPRPPAHYRCRSTTMPTLDGARLVGSRPFVSDSRDSSEREVAFRQAAKDKAGDRWAGMSKEARAAATAAEKRAWVAEHVGTVPVRTTYGEWLRRQPAEFQDEVLGKTRGALFRRGGLDVGSFVDASGKTLTLAELRDAEAAAFRRAGVGGT